MKTRLVAMASLGVCALWAVARMQHVVTGMAGYMYWQNDRITPMVSPAKGTLVSRLAGWTALPLSGGEQQSCAEVLQHRKQFSYNNDIADETYGADGTPWPDNDYWIGTCTCLRHTEAAFDASLQHAFRLSTDDHGASKKRLVIFDIGANHGQTLRDLFVSWQLAPSVAIHSFEPSPSNFALLRTAAEGITASEGTWSGTDTYRKWTSSDGRSRSITLWNIGMGPDAGQLTFYCPDTDPTCVSEQVSLLPTVGNVRFEAEVKTLGGLVPEILLPDDALAFLKIDAQGYDCEILQGLDFDAHKFPVLLWEVFIPFLKSTNATEGRCSFRGQVDLLAWQGYRVFVMNPLAGPVRIDGAFFEPRLSNKSCMNLFAVSTSWSHGNEFIALYASFTIKEAWAMELLESHSKGAAAKQWEEWTTRDGNEVCAPSARSTALFPTELVASDYVASLTCDL